MAKRKKQAIGLQNRLEIVIQSLLDFGEEGGEVAFDVEAGRLLVEIGAVVEADGRFHVTPGPVSPNSDDAE